VPPTAPGSKYQGAINIGNTGGGTNWPGAGFDPETGTFYSQASNASVTLADFGEEEFEQIRVENQSDRKPRWEAEPDYGLSRGRAAAPAAGRGRGRGTVPPALTGRALLGQGLQGLSIVKPPYGVLSAIDLNDGTRLLFQVPHGDTPDSVRNNPLLRGMNIPKTGQPGSVGVLITKTLVIAADPQVTDPGGRPRGAMMRAYHKRTGEQVGAVLMPAQVSGSPMTYSINGKQYIVIATSGGNETGQYTAYALP
jgi:quinoprotein glucose dehydrogenase